MTIIAIARDEATYMYFARSAHSVSKASANYICKICNEYKYRLKDGEAWHVYEIGEYDLAFDYAREQRGRVYRGIVKMYSPLM